MSIEENVCKEKKFHTSTPIYVQCDKLYRQRFAVKNSGMCCLALIFNLSYLRMTILHAKNRLKVAKHDESFTVFLMRSTQTCGLVKASSSESDDMGSIPAGCCIPEQPFCHFTWH